MKTVVCDASPLIFLAKLDRLLLIAELLGGRIHVLRCVVDEICSEGAGALEIRRLRTFLERVSIVNFEVSESSSPSLSRSDRSTLTWAIEKRADWLVADERLLRRIATQEGIAVIGFLGLLVAGARRGILTPEQARSSIDDAVGMHRCRISVALYQKIVRELDSL